MCPTLHWNTVISEGVSFNVLQLITTVILKCLSHLRKIISQVCLQSCQHYIFKSAITAVWQIRHFLRISIPNASPEFLTGVWYQHWHRYGTVPGKVCSTTRLEASALEQPVPFPRIHRTGKIFWLWWIRQLIFLAVVLRLSSCDTLRLSLHDQIGICNHKITLDPSCFHVHTHTELNFASKDKVHPRTGHKGPEDE